MKEELWKCIPEYDGYIVSNKGRVMVLPSKTSARKGKVLKPRKQYTGYYQVGLTVDGVKTFEYVHRLVAMAFLKRKKDYRIVMHLDDNPSNNNLENLRWGTHYQNSAMITKFTNSPKRYKMKDLCEIVLKMVEANSSFSGSKKELIQFIADDLGYTHAYIQSVLYHHSKK